MTSPDPDPAAGAASPGPDGRMGEWPTGRLLSTAARLVEHAWAEALEKQGLTHAGLIALHLLDAGPLSQSELAARARVENQTMSRTVERLEREGFVRRAPDRADRRRQVVTRTEAGREVWVRTRSLEAELFPRLGDPQGLRETLLEIIRSASGQRWGD
jgi:DNA-binding MarR family transcriptional regulator